MFLKIFTAFKLGRKLLLTYPRLFTFGVFSHQGPTEEQMAVSTFSIDFFAKGYKNFDEQKSAQEKPDLRVHTRVSGQDAGVLTLSASSCSCGCWMGQMR